METTNFDEQRQDLLLSIERDEEELRVAVHELTGAARSTLNVREQIKKFPLTCAVSAFIIGAWLGIRVAPRNVVYQRNVV